MESRPCRIIWVGLPLPFPCIFFIKNLMFRSRETSPIIYISYRLFFSRYFCYKSTHCKMRFSFIVFFLLCIACGSSTTDEDQKKTNEVVDPIPLKLDSVSLYQLTKHPVTDSLLLPLKAFSEYNQKINDLAKLEPTGIEPFILGTLIKCDVLLKKVYPHHLKHQK